jgi:flagellar basal-body rod modification protein FlgD
MPTTPIDGLRGDNRFNSPFNPLDTASRIPQQTLGQNEFLKILVAQMTSQDPLNPKADTDFAAQMAQFTSLEQSKQMSADMALLQANSLLGRTVMLRDNDGNYVTGEVTAVRQVEGTPHIVVGHNRYKLGSVLSIEPTVVPARATP